MAPPSRPSFSTNRGPGGLPATWASCQGSRVSTSLQRPPAALAARRSSERIPWRACALRGKRSWTPPRSVLQLRGSAVRARASGAVPQLVAPGNGGWQEEEEEGLCGRMVSVGAWAPPEPVDHPQPRPRARAGHCA